MPAWIGEIGMIVLDTRKSPTKFFNKFRSSRWITVEVIGPINLIEWNLIFVIPAKLSWLERNWCFWLRKMGVQQFGEWIELDERVPSSDRSKKLFGIVGDRASDAKFEEGSKEGSETKMVAGNFYDSTLQESTARDARWI